MVYLNNNTASQKVYIPKEPDNAHRTEWDAGYEAGMDFQKSLLSSATFTTNGTYTNEDGWSGVTVDVDEQTYYDSGYTEGYQVGYDSGYTSGSTDGYNTGYSSGYTDGSADGYASGETLGYASGYTKGVDYQKSLLSSTTFRNNGTYENENGWSSVTVDTPTVVNNQSKTITLSTGQTQTAWETGISVLPDAGYSGLSDVLVKTNFKVLDPISVVLKDNGYYFLDGEYVGFPGHVMEGFSVQVDVDSAGTYTHGYNDGYADGYTSGETDQRALLSSVTITDPVTSITSQDGWSAVTVNVDTTQYFNSGYTSGCTDGYASGVTDQKALLTSITITQPSTSVTSQDGFSGVTVNVPMTGLSAGVGNNGLFSYDPHDYGVEAFDSFEVNVRVMYNTITAVYVTTAANTTISLWQNATDLVALDINNTLSYENLSREYLCETAGTYVVKYFTLTDLPDLVLNDSHLVSVTIETQTKSLDRFNIRQGVAVTAITNNSSAPSLPMGFFEFTTYQASAPLTSYTVSDAVYDIGSYAFQAANLSELTLGSNVRSIGHCAFAGNHNLSAITCTSTAGAFPVPTAFSSISQTGTLYIPTGKQSSYSYMIAALPSGWSVVEQ